MEYLTSRVSPKYLYLTGRIRALENLLLREQDFSYLEEEKEKEKILSFLQKKPLYADSLKGEELEEGMEREWTRTRESLRFFSPEPELVDLFWWEKDFHNFKILLKAKSKGKEIPEELISFSGTLSWENLKEAIEEEKTSLLPSPFREMTEEGLLFLKQERTPLEIDLWLDRKMWALLGERMRDYKDPFLDGLIQLLLDLYHLNLVVRVTLRREETLKEFFERGVVEGGGVEKEKWLHILSRGLESLSEFLKGTDYYEFVEEELTNWKKEDLSSLEDFQRKKILSFTYRGFYVSSGREVLINYIFLKKFEIERIRKGVRSSHLTKQAK